MELFFNLLQQLCVLLVFAYLFSKSPAFKPLTGETLQLGQKSLLYLIFCSFSIIGSYAGLHEIANTGTIGAVLAGLLGGPLLGSAVGITAGLHRFALGGFTAPTGGLAIAVAGLIGGLVHRNLQQNNKANQLFSPLLALEATLLAEVAQLAIILLLNKPFGAAWSLVQTIALPLLIVNPVGAALFMSMMRDQKTVVDKVGALFSAKAFSIADRSLGILSRGFNAETARQLAQIIYEETGVGAVGISDREKILAFVGVGADHHLTGLDIVSPQTKEAIRENKVLFADGVNEFFACALSDNCPLGSTLIVPLRVDNEVIGTIKLYEPKHKLFLNLNKTLGEGLAKLLGEQLLRDRYQTQKNLLTRAELKLIQAQVNPHFLFNALNTIIAVVRKDAGQARSLLLHLSNFFRKNLKRSSDLASLEEELDHVKSYLVIEEARFGSRLQVSEEIDPELLKIKIPTFTLQPIVENAVKHGISQMLEAGVIKITAGHSDSLATIAVEDNAGTFCDRLHSDGLGMNIVDKRLKNLYGESYGISTSCVPERLTRVEIRVPYSTSEAP